MQNQQPNLYDTAALVVYNADIFCEELTVPVKKTHLGQVGYQVFQVL